VSLPPGRRLDQYDILSPLGKGGMGELYRAFNHPHICTINDLHEHGDTPFIVMELLKWEEMQRRE
jgi:serine/threonine protein kinase